MSGLSTDDFNRLQYQLLELREVNCTLKEIELKQKKELINARPRIQVLETENIRYTNIIKTSKKASEVGLLQRDNQHLHCKIRDQEEDFRLQNNTLLQELSKLVGENETLEEQVSALCKGISSSHDTSDSESCTDDVKKILGLRGELTLLEKKLKETESSSTTETTALKDRINLLVDHNTQLTNILKQNSIPFDEGEISLNDGGGVSFKKIAIQDDDGLETDFNGVDETTSQQWRDNIETLQQEVSTTQQKLNQQQQTTNNVNKQLEEQYVKHQKELKALIELSTSEGNNKLCELQLEVTSKSEECIKLCKSEEDLTIQVNQVQSLLSQTQSQLDIKMKDHSSLKEQLEMSKNELEESRASNDALVEDSAVMQHSRQQLLQENNLLITRLQEQTKLADSRKGLIDEMKTHIMTQEDELQHQIESLKDNHSQQLITLTSLITKLEMEVEWLNQQVNKTKELEESLKVEHNLKIQLDDQISNLNEQLLLSVKKFNEEKVELIVDKLKEMDNLRTEQVEERKDFSTQLEINSIQKQELEDTVETLKRQVADEEEERKIHERKGIALLKDLKKQLSGERKRADRLQEKLSQLLTDPAQLTALTCLSDPGDDASSVSSWSMVSGEPRDTSTRENSIIISPQVSPTPGSMSDEMTCLVIRVAELQQQKWQLEERVTHLETSSAAMADDVIKKSAIIHHYCIDHTSNSNNLKKHDPVVTTGGAALPNGHPLLEKTGVKKVFDLLREVSNVGKGEESFREINRRLQVLLEETLAKNMHLHMDVDNLTKQVKELTDLAASKAHLEPINNDDYPPEVDVTDVVLVK